MTSLVEEVEFIRSNTIASNSKNIYINSSSKFLIWLYQVKPDSLTNQFIGFVNEHGVSTNTMKNFLGQKDEKPLKFEGLNANDFMLWLVSLRTKSGEKPGYSTYNSHRSIYFI